MDTSARETAGAPRRSSRPLIGVSGNAASFRLADVDVPVTLAPQKVIDRIVAAGGAPVVLPSLPDLDGIVARLDGLVVPGGPDVDPRLYGADAHPNTGRTDPDRDRAELALLAAAIDGEVPFLGICRGLQLLNVLRGGTLHQYLPDVTGHDGHWPGRKLGVLGSQQVRLEPGGQVAAILNGGAPAGATTVPCHHSQAIDRLGSGLAVTGRADDGTIEAVELPGHPFGVTVQWHDEESGNDGLFAALAEAARQSARRRGR